MNDNKRLPKKAFDSEYMTEWRREVEFLSGRGINYTFVKLTPDYGVRQYKYKKTRELFTALAEFYGAVELAKMERLVEEHGERRKGDFELPGQLEFAADGSIVVHMSAAPADDPLTGVGEDG